MCYIVLRTESKYKNIDSNNCVLRRKSNCGRRIEGNRKCNIFIQQLKSEDFDITFRK